MKQKVEEIIIELSMLNDDLRDTQRIIDEKKFELQSICPHDKLDKRIVMKKDLRLPKIGLPCPDCESYIYYKCKICGWGIIKDNEDPELEKRVVII